MTSEAVTEDLGALLALVAGADQTAFTDFYDRTAARVHGLVLRVLRDRAQAEEVTQEVFLQVWRTAAAFDPSRGSPLAWLLTLAHHRAVDRVRSAVARTTREGAYEARAVTPPFDSTSEEAQARVEAEQVRLAVAELSPGHREAVELAFFDGLTHREVSEHLGLPLGTAKTRIRDGLTQLRRQMGGER